MTQLAALRSRLESLRAARAAVQWGGALAAVLSGGLLIAIGAWGLDILFRWDRGSRFVILAAALAAGVMLLVRRIGPLLHRRESLAQLALWVERQHRLDGDLVSALQFEQPAAREWGSPRLTAAVVDYVADFSRSLNVFEGFSWETLPRRLAVLATLVIITGGLIVAAPTEAVVFWNRFWLGAARYPTRTQIAQLRINGREIAPHRTDPLTIAVPQNEPLVLEVVTAGEPTETAMAVVRGRRSGERGQWPLSPAGDHTFRFTQPALAESLRVGIRAGDAESDFIDIAVVPLPMVDIRWTVTPPAYARSASPVEIPPGTRSFAVLAGSRVECAVTSANKRLQSVVLRLLSADVHAAARPDAEDTLTLTLSHEARERGQEEDAVVTPQSTELASIALTASDSDWTTPPHARLDVLREPLRYELPILDVDGLAPQPAIIGEIRLQTDRPPRVSAAAVSRKVLPQAQPRVSYGAVDDYGLGEVRLEWEVIPEEGPRRTDRRVIRPRSADTAAEKIVRGELPFDLSALKVVRGDEVRVTIVADDERGDFPPQPGRSEPVIFAITDKAGILESLLEIDQQSAQQLDAIIEKELGIGGPTR
jgi:hypothetical protein